MIHNNLIKSKIEKNEAEFLKKSKDRIKRKIWFKKVKK